MNTPNPTLQKSNFFKKLNAELTKAFGKKPAQPISPEESKMLNADLSRLRGETKNNR